MAKKGVIKTQEKFISDVHDKYGDKYTIIGQYLGSTEKLLVKYNDCGHEAMTKANYIMAGKGCPICNRGVKLSDKEVFDMISKKYNNEYSYVSGYKNNRSKIDVIHNLCGTMFNVNASHALYNDCNCPRCYNEKLTRVVSGINDINAVNLDLFNLLKDKSDGYKYAANSTAKTWFICDCCKSNVYASIAYVNQYGLPCPVCGKGYSYAERFMGNILMELDIQFTPQYSPKWIQPYRYDFFFEIYNHKYIVEMDGGWHYEDNRLSGVTYDDTKQRDDYKDQMAINHDIEIIRIDCNYIGYDKLEYISKNIKNSKLFSLLNLNDDILYYAGVNAEKPIMQNILSLWNADCKSIRQISEKLHISDTTIRRYLYLASDNDIICESKNDIKRINYDYQLNTIGSNHKTAVLCNETGEVFKTIKDGNKKYHANISAYFSKENRKFSGTLPDGTRLTWTKLS